MRAWLATMLANKPKKDGNDQHRARRAGKLACLAQAVASALDNAHPRCAGGTGMIVG